MADTNPYTSTRICEDCGKVVCTDDTIESVSKIFGEKGAAISAGAKFCPECGQKQEAKRFCPECAEKRHRARTAAWWAKKKDEISSPYPKEETAAQRIRNAEERDAAFRADCRAADAAGLSYGKYMLLKNKQACPCANTDKPKR